MTLTENAASRADAVSTGCGRRLPLTDVGAYLHELPEDTHANLHALGELLVGLTQPPAGAESADRFTGRCLGVPDGGILVDDDSELNPVSRLTTAVALTQWMTTPAEVVDVGPGHRYRATPAEGVYL